MSRALDILRADTTTRLKLRRWRKKGVVLLQRNAIGIAWRQFSSTSTRDRGITTQSAPHAIILMYHRIADPVSDPQLLCVSPRHFAEHLAVIQERFRIVPLRELAARAQSGECVRGTAAITFDDGYADNLHQAKPLLQRFGAPATVFVTSGLVGTRKEFWWDELERLLLQPGELPAYLELQAGGQTYAWHLKGDAHYSDEDCARDRNWNCQQPGTPTRRHEVYRGLHMLLSLLGSPERERTLAQLRSWAGLGSEGRETHRALTDEEVRELARGELVEVGAHTDTHPVLSMLPAAMQKSEIATSKQRLEQLLGRPVRSFAYPYGALADYKAVTVKAVAELGFEAACSTFSNVITGRCDRLQLPRFTVRNWDGETLRRYLQEWSMR